jgi:peptidyl-prolyl cis-trans isomerase SurA
LLEKVSVELRWNLLVASLFKNKIIINEEGIKEKIQKISKNQKINEYLVSEIFIDSENKTELKKKLEKILISIDQVGFKNTAIQFSSSPSSQEGGELGWLSEDQISEKLLEEMNKIEPGMISKPIPTSNGLLLLKVHEKKTSKKEINIKQNLQKLILIEKNKQLRRFGINYLNKIRINAKIKHL